MSLSALSQSVTTLNGFAPGFVGNNILVEEYDDYFSSTLKKIGETEVKKDSSFSLSFYSDTTKKIKLSIEDYSFHIYVEPGSSYNLYINGSLLSYKNEGRDLDLDYYFLDLDSSDINYKILRFEDKLYSFLQKQYNHKNRTSEVFTMALEELKVDLESDIDQENDLFFLNYVRFSLAQIDDLPFKGSRNRYEKYDFYIKPSPVLYNNDRYMEYIYQYYKGYYHQLSKSVNESFYDGVIRSSPTLLMRSLSGDYAMESLRLRELVIIRMMAELYYNDDIPETNVTVILDSLSENAAFEQNQNIAKNMLNRITDLVPGVSSPNFTLTSLDGQSLVKSDLNGKYTYIHFLDDSKLSKGDFEILKKLNTQYGDYVEFVTIVKMDKNEDHEILKGIFTLPEELKKNWSLFFVEKEHYIFDKYKVPTFPYYVALDQYTNIYAAPALSPRPNNEYETIERFLFNVKKINTRRN
jgi:hypothetical protein